LGLNGGNKMSGLDKIVDLTNELYTVYESFIHHPNFNMLEDEEKNEMRDSMGIIGNLLTKVAYVQSLVSNDGEKIKEGKEPEY